MQSAPSIWRTSAEQDKLPSEYRLKKFVEFYSKRLQLLLLTLFLSVAICGVISLAIRFPQASIIILAALLAAALAWFLSPDRSNVTFLRLLREFSGSHMMKERRTTTRITGASRIIEDVYVLHLSGGLVADKSDELVEQVRSALHQGYNRILVDLSDVGYMDSRGIGNLVSCYTLVHKEGGQLKLFGLTSRVQDLLKSNVETYYDEKSALASFRTTNESGTTYH